MINLKKFVFNPFGENTYLLWDKDSKETVVVDPGISEENEEETFTKFVTQNKLKIKYLLNTHCHVDHIIGNAFIKEKYDCKFYVPEKDLPLLEQLPEHAERFGLKVVSSPKPDAFLSEEIKLQLGNSEVEMLFTPGHTPGEFCFLFRRDKLCITGDVLFKEGIGRTDLWGGNYETLIASIQNKLFSLPDDVEVFPGHGYKTTIGYEKNNNPFLT